MQYIPSFNLKKKRKNEKKKKMKNDLKNFVNEKNKKVTL